MERRLARSEIALMNLCAADAPAARLDKSGNTVLKLVLPGHLCVLSVRLEGGDMAAMPMQIDTVIIEPQLQSIQLVWRACYPIAEDAPDEAVRMFEILLYSQNEQERLWGVKADGGGLPEQWEQRCIQLTADVMSRALGPELGLDSSPGSELDVDLSEASDQKATYA
jgi:hypothetical protein